MHLIYKNHLLMMDGNKKSYGFTFRKEYKKENS